MPFIDQRVLVGKLILLSLLLSGILLTLAFAPFNVGFLSYIAFIPLLAWDLKRPFLAGFAFGIVHYASLLFWILFLVVPPPTKNWVVLGVIVLIIYLSLYYGVLSLAIKRLGVISMPFVLVLLEFIRSQGDLGFPWGVVGYSQTFYLPVLQFASIFGIYGLSFIVGLFNLIIFLIVKNRKFYLVPIPFVIFFSGLTVLKPTHYSDLKVGILQPNINTNIVWNQGLRERTFDVLVANSDSLADEGAMLVIWPESSIPMIIASHQVYKDKLKALADSNQISILLGTGIVERKGRLKLYNGAILVKPDLGVVDTYKKIHLVPFSEHLPYEQKLRFLKNIDFGQGNYWPGSEFTIFDVGRRFGCLICFESIFPELSRRYIADGADFLVNITNDGWFSKSPGPFQHAEMAIVRGVEQRVPLIRCANTGVSMVVDPYGRIIKKSEIFKKASLVVNVPESGVSTYLHLGDLIVYISVAVLGLLLIRSLRPSLFPFGRR